MRAYIGLVRDLNFTIQQPMTIFLENELTAARQRDSSVSSSTMHTWLTVRATNSIHLSLMGPLSWGSCCCSVCCIVTYNSASWALMAHLFLV